MSQQVRLRILLATVCLFAGSDSYAKTRGQASTWALNNQVTPGWTPIKVSHIWSDGLVFRSQYSTKSGSPYVDYPYVYGGNDSPQEVYDRIIAGAVPGGVNAANPLLTTGDIYVQEFPNGEEPAKYLAGIDCSGFASLALGIEKRKVSDLAAVSVKRDDPSDVEVGDLLINLNGEAHVKVVTAVDPLGVVEAAAGNTRKVVGLKIGTAPIYSM